MTSGRRQRLFEDAVNQAIDTFEGQSRTRMQHTHRVILRDNMLWLCTKAYAEGVRATREKIERGESPYADD